MGQKAFSSYAQPLRKTMFCITYWHDLNRIGSKWPCDIICLKHLRTQEELNVYQILSDGNWAECQQW